MLETVFLLLYIQLLNTILLINPFDYCIGEKIMLILFYTSLFTIKISDWTKQLKDQIINVFTIYILIDNKKFNIISRFIT